jgi:hypothetical protein
MRKIMSIAAALAAVVGLLAAPAAASARVRPNLSVYTINSIDVSNPSGLNAYFALYATFSATQVWVNTYNGKNVTCNAQPGWAYSWCNITNNGQVYLNAGMNLDNAFGSWYVRMNIYANYGGCRYWWGAGLTIDDVQCEVNPNLRTGARASDLRLRPAILHSLTPIATLHLRTGTVREYKLPTNSVYERT